MLDNYIIIPTMEIHNRLIFKYKTIIVQIRMGSQ